MRILIVKTSSMGDVIHTLPAVTELGNNMKDIIIDWVVEDSFVDIPKYHKYVNKVIPVAIRKWRKNLINKEIRKEIELFLHELRRESYDYVIDAQGLLKSVLITKFARANVSHGLDNMSIRGKYISWLYDKTYNVKRNIHAVYRIKLLFSEIFAYTTDLENNDYGLDLSNQNMNGLHDLLAMIAKPYVVFLHCTTWNSKKWPKEKWLDLAKLVIDSGYNVLFNAGNLDEYAATQQMISSLPKSVVFGLPPLTIANLITIIANSKAVVSVDTGLGHLAAALDKPGVGLFGATDTILTGFLSNKFDNFKSGYYCSPCLLRECNKLTNDNNYPPCYNELSVATVFDALVKRLELSDSFN